MPVLLTRAHLTAIAAAVHARHELLQINVAGTLQSPKVSATAMNTFTTTIDQVLQGSNSDVTPDGKVHKGY